MKSAACAAVGIAFSLDSGRLMGGPLLFFPVFCLERPKLVPANLHSVMKLNDDVIKVGISLR